MPGRVNGGIGVSDCTGDSDSAHRTWDVTANGPLPGLGNEAAIGLGSNKNDRLTGACVLDGARIEVSYHMKGTTCGAWADSPASRGGAVQAEDPAGCAGGIDSGTVGAALGLVRNPASPPSVSSATLLRGWSSGRPRTRKGNRSHGRPVGLCHPPAGR
ncbi:hypothetical protein [Streptomyces anandii]|uniref:hypothetical protein n=1 Tax=Streptomyces anandii TaxID=285454 RepID=UPI0036848867